MTSRTLIVRDLGIAPYEPVWRAMQHFTETRSADTCDEIWFVEHHAVFTQGRNGRERHVLDAAEIPVIRTDRGGQVTYHGPGQIVVYALLDLRRCALGIRNLVESLEQAVADTLSEYGVSGRTLRQAPGVYVQDRKIASVGLRVRGGRSYHGLSLNVDMDLQPFRRIHPCGYAGLEVTQLADHYPHASLNAVKNVLRVALQCRLRYNEMRFRQAAEHRDPLQGHAASAPS